MRKSGYIRTNRATGKQTKVGDYDSSQQAARKKVKPLRHADPSRLLVGHHERPSPEEVAYCDNLAERAQDLADTHAEINRRDDSRFAMGTGMKASLVQEVADAAEAGDWSLLESSNCDSFAELAKYRFQDVETSYKGYASHDFYNTDREPKIPYPEGDEPLTDRQRIENEMTENAIARRQAARKAAQPTFREWVREMFAYLNKGGR